MDWCHFKLMFSEGLAEKVTFEERRKGGDGVNHADAWGKGTACAKALGKYNFSSRKVLLSLNKMLCDIT